MCTTLPVELLQEGAPDLECVFRRQAVLREAVAQRAAGKDRHGAVVLVLDRAADRPAQARAVVQVMRLAQRRDRDHLVVLVGVHVAHGHQRAVFGVERGGVVRQRLDAVRVAGLGQQLAQRRVARELEAHVADEVRQLVAGVQALEVRRAVDVVVGVDEPVRVEHHDGVHAPRGSAATPVNLQVTVNR
jgi:hypothetical protein